MRAASWKLPFVAALVAAAACAESQTIVVEPPDPPPTGVPQVDRTVWATGFTNPWDIGFLPNGEALITERPGRVRLRRADGAMQQIAQIPGVVASGEGGLLGLAIDPQFATNRFVYLCYSSNQDGANDNRLVRWRLADDGSALQQPTVLVTGMPWANGGRHSGCRPRFGVDGMLWVGTGDAAIGANPQNLASLGGKVLRVTRDGAPAAGNPATGGMDPRIYSFGHRNVQGLAMRANGTVYAVEHGPSFDDEVTPLAAGGNAGWNPVPGYNESVPMTDLTRYPGAMRPVWTSGRPARGTSGATFISGAQWGTWNGALALTQLVGTKLVILTLTPVDGIATETNLFVDLGTRLRVPVQGPDGALYLATDVGGGGGQIWRVAPRAP